MDPIYTWCNNMMKFGLTQHQNYFHKAEHHFALPENKNDLFGKEFFKNYKILSRKVFLQLYEINNPTLKLLW